MIAKRCLDCPAIVDHRRTRCEPCQDRHDGARAERTPRPYDQPRYREWRTIVRLRAGGICQRCGKPDEDPRWPHEADHVVAVVDGGERFDPHNGQLLCHDCHVDKTGEDRRARASRITIHENETIVDAGPVVG